MREFVYYSPKARTSGNWKDLMKAGRMDIVCNVIIQGLFLSHDLRKDVHLHMIFCGAPNPPMHLEFISNPKMPISKKDVAGLIKRMLYKVGKEKKEIFPGCFIEKKSFMELMKELQGQGKKIFIMEKRGKNIRELRDAEINNGVFVIGDDDGLPKKEIKRFDNKVNVGKKTYFASQVFVIINNEMDLRRI